MLNFEESIISIFNMTRKFSGALIMFSGFLLLSNNKWLALPLEQFKQDNLQLLWITFYVSVCVFLNDALKDLTIVLKRYFNDWNTKRKFIKNKREENEKNLNILIDRLKSLNKSEIKWIQYCLYHNSQTLNAPITNGTANSLCTKCILHEGYGNYMNLPYTIPDSLWNYLNQNYYSFIPENMTNTEIENFISELDKFKNSFRLY